MSWKYLALFAIVRLYTSSATASPADPSKAPPTTLCSGLLAASPTSIRRNGPEQPHGLAAVGHSRECSLASFHSHRLEKAVNALGWRESNPDAYQLIYAILFRNIVLFDFQRPSHLPHSTATRFALNALVFLLAARATVVASFLGFFRVAGLIVLAVLTRSIWTGLIAAYAGMNC